MHGAPADCVFGTTGVLPGDWALIPDCAAWRAVQ